MGARFLDALFGVFGLPKEDPDGIRSDIVFGALLGFAMLFVVGAVAEFEMDLVTGIALAVGLVLLLIAKRKRMVLGSALMIVGLRFCFVLVLTFKARFLLFTVACFVLGGWLLYTAARVENRRCTDNMN